MKKFVKKQKGITLIALIITIIVMLILVAVTINVALNGGLFDKAKKASDDTQRESDREQLIAAAMACIGTDGKVVLTGANGLDSNLPEGFKLVSSGIYENKKTGKQYKVDSQTGKVEEYTQDNTIPAGTYTTSPLFENAAGISSIKLNDGGTGVWTEGENGINMTYTFTDNTISITLASNSSFVGSNSVTANYKVVNNNKILDIGGMGLIFSTNINELMHYAIYKINSHTLLGYEIMVDNILYTGNGPINNFELATIPLNGRTYIGDSGDGGDLKIVFGETIVNGVEYGTLTQYTLEDDSWSYESDHYYCIVNNTLYYVNKEDFRAGDPITINEGYTLITLENGYLEYQAP